MKKIYNNLFKIAVLVVFVTLINACTTNDLEPSTEQNKAVETGIQTVENLKGILKGAYASMESSSYYGRDLIILGELRTDNCFSNGNSGRFVAEASFNYNNNYGFFWSTAYKIIANTNIIIGKDPATLTAGDINEAKHIQGQAYAIRALVYYDLLTQYGQTNTGGTLGVPYVSKFKDENLYPSRNTIEECKTKIFEDLTMAFQLMSDDYYDASKQKMSKYTAKAIESRVAVYFKDWARAKSAAQSVINSGIYTIAPASGYVSSFASDSPQNSIFELAFSAADNLSNTSLGFIYRLGQGGTYGDVQVIDEVIDIYEDTDVRKSILGYEGTKLRNIGKYPSINGHDDVIVIRFEEVVLNYAEALFELSDATALTWLNKIPENRDATAYTSITKDNILNERRKELIFEGFRFNDLMRTGKGIDKISAQQNFLASVPYGDHKLALPIPVSETDANSNIEQNKGY